MSASRSLRIGVDVGGTNTDGVIIDPTRSRESDKGIVAWHKAPTTADPSHGIADAITTMFKSASVDPSSVASVTIGTTHFVNAVITRDTTRLSPVAVIRLSGPFSKHAPPGVDWPAALRKIILAHYALVKGGLEIDGSLISDIKEQEIVNQCKIIKEKGIKSIVINGVFSPIDTIERQEERAAEIVKRELGENVDVVLSKTVANLGFLERENAAILNASILSFARKTITSFQSPIKKLGLNCPVFITQNDGTILSGEAASRLPIRTFSSGPTNSMRGAAFLVGKQEDGQAMMVVDVGGTTTDVGLLLANGFPRQQAAYSELSGVRMNFSYPDVKSIGLGGGSLVRRVGDKLQVGPESVGYRLQEKALIFGGDVPTATDYTVAGLLEVNVGDPEKVRGILDDKDIAEFKNETKAMLERIVDTMKTSPEDLPVLLVGGGAVIAPDTLKGASRVIKPQWSGVANAIGAAMARVSAVVDTVKSTEKQSEKELLVEISEETKKRTVDAGALADSVAIVEIEALPLQYVANKTRFIVRAAGDFDFSRARDFADLDVTKIGEVVAIELDNAQDRITPASIEDTAAEDDAAPQIDIVGYRPKVVNREWWISETDLDWITIGCYILGTGGGGSPYSTMLRVREILRAGGTVRVVSPDDLKDEDLIGSGGAAGSPTVGIEKLPADEIMDAQNSLYELFKGGRATHVIPIEIGGSNGLQGLVIGASSNMNVPCVDGDWMGRAYPTKWQTTPVVFGEREIVFAPVAVADGNGNTLYMPTAASDFKVEQVIRSALSQMGSAVGTADAPVTGEETRRWAVEHTISLSWRIGREVARARKENRIDNVAESIIDAVGGPETGRVLFKGKIVGVERKLWNGHVYGEVIIEGTDAQCSDKVKIPFKNENIAAIRMHDGEECKTGEECNEDVLAIVPDLIAVIDAHNGEAIGTPEYRYGLLVLVIGITASERWTSPKGIEIGGPNSFGLNHLTYKPLGKFVKPVSVIDEYDGRL
ncbi:hydantoinase [Didymella exigua CBS 183.55]|uniref:Hydantoinase n=1 Tax=Didymella exigua CBS 183.55 TaxID=1150837 RepID=A0A6A5RUJ5_9PLEO|nr:hydantoinase [Didymella exigua CBS 183.55]KAF1932111.1 hydantoinase [Didymella exigua CBS 183.55]